MSSSTESAVTIVAREQAELLPVERDRSPLGPGEVAGRTLVSLVSAGTELAGNYQGSRFPSVPGYAAVIAVEGIGSEVTDLSVGDRVFCMGPHRSFQRAPRASVLRLPEGMAPEVGVFARMMSVSMSTLTTTTARPPQKVLVMGLGLVGHLAAQIFARCGYELYACDPVPERRQFAREEGIRNILDAVPIDDPSLAGQVALVLECSGHEQGALDGCRVVRKGGEVVLIGAPWQRRTELTAHELLHAVFHRYVRLRSGWEWELPLHPAEFRGNSIWENLGAALRWLEEGSVRVNRLYAAFSPGEAQRAYQQLLDRRGERLAVIFDWR
jgi:threonine dehydrogenase-like Zn-dependent dehydrogenase